MSRAPCSPSTEPPAPKGRKPRLRTSTRPNAKGALSASTAGSAPCSVCKGSCVPEFRLRPGRSFPQGHVSERAPRFERRFWDTVSATGLSRKLHPTLSAHSGTQFPNGPRFGNHIPFRAFKAGRGFPERVSTTCRRRPRLLLLHRAPACGGGIRARRAWRAPGDGVRAG